MAKRCNFLPSYLYVQLQSNAKIHEMAMNDIGLPNMADVSLQSLPSERFFAVLRGKVNFLFYILLNPVDVTAELQSLKYKGMFGWLSRALLQLRNQFAPSAIRYLQH